MRIVDLELMQDISSLFEKKIVIWGMQEKGRTLLKEILDMGGGKKGIILCDSDRAYWGEQVEGLKIESPQKIEEYLKAKNAEGFLVCITCKNVQVQDEIIVELEQMYTENVDVCTEYGMEWGIYLNLMNQNVDDSYRRKMLIEHDKNRITYEESSMTDQMKYFAYAPLHNDEMILIYQPGKVGSRSLYWSLKDYGKYILHSHALRGSGYEGDTLQRLLEQKSAKVISLVRDPLARRISEMWQNIPSVNRYSAEVDFAEIEQCYYKEGFECMEFEWFHEELESVLGINVYDYPFDRKEGYAVIQKNNIELLLMKVEKLSALETVVGRFTGISDFRLQNRNVSGEKRYRFAYQQYIERFAMPQERLRQIYYENPYINFFYTEEEINGFYQKWLRD
ncbi:MAG: hypothetical protein HDR09_04645 [Lachnospiraceae bacterium]|nr:hypothetical protein [Lachnospiraceae bacterium]